LLIAYGGCDSLFFFIYKCHDHSLFLRLYSTTSLFLLFFSEASKAYNIRKNSDQANNVKAIAFPKAKLKAVQEKFFPSVFLQTLKRRTKTPNQSSNNGRRGRHAAILASSPQHPPPFPRPPPSSLLYLPKFWCISRNITSCSSRFCPCCCFFNWLFDISNFETTVDQEKLGLTQLGSGPLCYCLWIS